MTCTRCSTRAGPCSGCLPRRGCCAVSRCGVPPARCGGVDVVSFDAANFDASRGLDEHEAAARRAQHGANTLPAAKGSGVLAQAWRQLVTEPMFLLLLAAAALYLLLGSRAEGLLLGTFALITVALVLVQNQRSRKALDALRAMAAPQARVLRGGVARTCAAADVVPGDALLLDEGERVAADAVLHRANALAIDESLLTGESAPVAKGVALPVFGGTLVVAGNGIAEVTATGAASEAGRIGVMLNQLDDTPTRLQRDTARLVRVLGALAAAISVAIVLLSVARGSTWIDAVLSAIAVAMALLPEEFALAMTVFFVIGAWRLAQQQVLVRRSAAIETLGAATVLAVDKTGTLTENRMRLRRAVSDAGVWDATANAAPPATTNALLQTAWLATREHSADPMDRALRALPGLQASAGARRLHELPVAEGRPMYIALWVDANGIARAACKGAAEAVLARCRLPEPAQREWQKRAGDLAAQGWRVLGVATAPIDAAATQDHSAWRFEWLGLLAFEDPLRASVPAAVALAREAGIGIKMITGDAPQTALAIAREAGIVVGDHSRALIGRDIDAMDDAALQSAVHATQVFARVSPAHKLRLVRAMQAGGEVVAMTGDGVNDAPALRAAHIGIGMGARGTDVAREAAALVLQDDDFGRIVQAVSQGRRIFDNLRKVMLYIVAIHVPIAGLALLPLLFGLPPLLLPAHVALTEMVIDPMCTLGYESLPAERAHMRQPPRPLAEPLIGRAQLLLGAAQGALLLAACFAIYGLALQRGVAVEAARFLTFVALTAGNLTLALVNTTQQPIARSGALARAFTWIACAAVAALGICVSVPALRALFAFAWPGAIEVALAALAGVLCVAWWDLAKRWPAVARTFGSRPGTMQPWPTPHTSPSSTTNPTSRN
jgi:P-type Ca2+ transporter type 2C